MRLGRCWCHMGLCPGVGCTWTQGLTNRRRLVPGQSVCVKNKPDFLWVLSQLTGKTETSPFHDSSLTILSSSVIYNLAHIRHSTNVCPYRPRFHNPHNVSDITRESVVKIHFLQTRKPKHRMAKRVVLLDKEFKDPSRLMLFPVHSALGTGGRVAGCRFSRRGGGLHFVVDILLHVIFIVWPGSKSWVDFPVNCFS